MEQPFALPFPVGEGIAVKPWIVSPSDEEMQTGGEGPWSPQRDIAVPMIVKRTPHGSGIPDWRYQITAFTNFSKPTRSIV
jgi:hypothetical protein